MRRLRPEPCIICNGKYSVEVVALTRTSEPVCKKHIEEITKILLRKQKEENLK